MKFLIVFMLVIASHLSEAQVVISGKLTDVKNKPLKGASVTIVDSYDGTTTDSLGNFSFTTTETGVHILSVSLSGYAAYTSNINIEKQPIIQKIAIKELITELNAVTITAGAFEASDKKKGTVLTSLDVVTTAGSNGDVTGALKTLPGTQQVGEAEGLFVRGGSATESKIFIDGSLVNNFFYSSLPGIATRGRFNPFLFKGTVFSTGGYSALYGQALSAALILESVDLPERTEADLSISAIGVGGGIQKLAKNKKAAWGISYNYTNLALAFAVIKQRVDFFEKPLYHQFDGNFRIKTKKGGFIKYYGYGSWNRTGLRNPDIDSVGLKNAFKVENLNTFQNISWKENLGNGWKINTAISFSTNRDAIENELQDAQNNKQIFTTPSGYVFKNFNLLNNATYAQARVVFDKRLKGINVIRFGTDYFYSKEKSAYTLYNNSTFTETVTDHLNAAFAETDLYLSNKLALKAGTRLEHSTLMNHWNLAPRASLAYKLKNASQVSFAYGIFYQNPERRYLPATNNNLQFAQASHYILQYQLSNKNYTFRSELFYKKYDDLFKTSFNNNGREVVSNNNGNGYAKGIEFFWRDKKTIKDFDYWISYSYLDTKRNYLNFPGSITPSFAATHTASLVTKKFVTPWKTGFNLSYNFATGRPYYNLGFDNTQGKYIIKEQGKTINYNSLSFSLNYLPNLGKTNAKAFSVWVLSVSNVLGQNQIFGYNFSAINNNKVPSLPPSKRFVYIGCFLSFGIDRTQDAINNNL
ncbi:carboxypeptidase-like regulatory domain-containing protein [Ferruginibacter yonginensis]|uniref:Carboxypeptidase-like regulatory domain-containing protein n=1 Tax=Ferruginibacter yonginensis TaxID=1310416 RepID=A0ABV8QQS1_9BACT